MKVSVNAPSYRRPNAVTTLGYLPFCRLWVCETEYDEYVAANPGADIVKVPKGVQGNVSRIRNYILDHADTDVICIIDDDMTNIGYYEQTKRLFVHPDEVLAFIEKYSELAVGFGVKLWGVNVNPDKQCYREYTPFSLVSYIGSPFSCHINSDLRYDERIPLKEDYDITLQHLNTYRKVLRVNKYFYTVKQGASGGGQPGGCAVMRNIEEEKRQFDILQKKWGREIVRRDSSVDRSHSSKKKRKVVDLNPVIRVPIGQV